MRVLLVALLLLMMGCTTPVGREGDNGAEFLDEEILEMGEEVARVEGGVLYRDPGAVADEREEFRERLKKTGKGGRGNKRALYEERIGVLGANGILAEIERLWPKCHSEAHALGQVIYDRVGDIGTGLRVCADGCYSGCMHGVLMEAFAGAQDPDDPDGHVDVSKVIALMNTLCSEDATMTASYSPGDCAHAVGHALMALTDYDVPKGVDQCRNFDGDAMIYYCATGAYMEYVTEHDKEDAKDPDKSLFYPCDLYDFPAACARYKAVHVVRRHYGQGGSTADLLQECRKLPDKYRLGCMHGLGNGHMGRLLKDKTKLIDLCLFDSATEEETYVCIEGAMERTAKYHPAKAERICEELTGEPREICETAVSHEMYNMEKDFTLYIRE